MTLLNTIMPRILGVLFYYPPDSAEVQRLMPLLAQLAELYPWSEPDVIEQQCRQLTEFEPSQLEYDFSILFEGQGEMPAPPWGSVYLDRENLLMGGSTLNYRRFLSSHNLVSENSAREPEDQFGLMLLAWVKLLESQQQQAALELLTQHLLPWAYRYLEHLQRAKTERRFYPILADIATRYLRTLEIELALSPAKLELYR